jgi:tetratricopeptide (TPR) repeat protein
MPYQHGRFEEADRLLGEALEQLVDPVARASVEADRAWIDGRRGNWSRAYRSLSKAVDVLQRGGAPAGLQARSLDRLGVAMRDAIDADGAISVLEQAHRLAVEAGDPRLAATVRMHLAGGYRQIGDVEAARREIEAALASCAMTGDVYIEAVTTWIAAEIEHVAGNDVEAIALRRRELELLGRQGGNDQNQAMAHAHIAFLARRIGDPELEANATRAARLVAQHSGQPHLPARIELALASQTWFIDDLVPRGSGPGNAAGTADREPSSHAT